MILMIDNYDSFTFNLVRYFEELGRQVVIRRNDALRVAEVAALAPSHLVISPGPKTPAEAGISLEVIRRYAGVFPILGVCLGHQAIGVVHGARLVRAARLMHGKTSEVSHTGTGIFRGLPSPLTVARYHSLILDPSSIPPELEVTAWTDQGEIMAVAHRRQPIFGVQFHPESILSEAGHALLERFLEVITPAFCRDNKG